jgi:chemotaxis signal transduction protein
VTEEERSDLVARLRDDFDRSFASPDVAPARNRADALAIRLGRESHLLLIAEIDAIHRGSKVVAVPSTVPELLGVAAIRGTIVPVYDLAALLGHEKIRVPRWCVRVRSNEALALAFETFEAEVRIPEEALTGLRATNEHEHELVRGATRLGGVLRPVLDLGAITRTVSRKLCTLDSR